MGDPKYKEKRLLGRSSSRRENNIAVNFTVIKGEDVGWIKAREEKAY